MMIMIRRPSPSLLMMITLLTSSLVLLFPSSADATLLNKVDLIEDFAEASGISQAEADRFINAWQRAVARLLRKQGSAALPGFGTIRAPTDDDKDYCDGIDDECDAVCEIGGEGCTLQTSICHFRCDPGNGSGNGNGGCGTQVGYSDLRDGGRVRLDANGELDFDADGDFESMNRLATTFMDQYWTDVITTLARSLDFNSSRSNRTSQRNSASASAATAAAAAAQGASLSAAAGAANSALLEEGEMSTASFENPVFVGSAGAQNNVLALSYIGIVSYWFAVLADLKTRTYPKDVDGSQQVEDWKETILKAAEAFEEKFLVERDTNPLNGQTVAVWNSALNGANEFMKSGAGAGSEISIDESDQITVLSSIEDFLLKDKDVKRTGCHDADLAKQMFDWHKTVLKAMDRGGVPSLVGFGSFSVSSRAARVTIGIEGGNLEFSDNSLVRMSSSSELKVKN
mmetsp:Transcript_21758/g.61922  ORF Transcript_21758/g.61922 Transcript_21758/m.61922 type:complete len:457 (-) Transcript_21758:72-1442(-)